MADHVLRVIVTFEALGRNMVLREELIVGGRQGHYHELVIVIAGGGIAGGWHDLVNGRVPELICGRECHLLVRAV